MTVEHIDLPNPPPMASRLPSETLELAKDLVKQPLDDSTAGSLKAFRNAADYIAAGNAALNCVHGVSLISVTAMIFLKDNALLERKLVSDDIKARLLGFHRPVHIPVCLRLTVL